MVIKIFNFKSNHFAEILVAQNLPKISANAKRLRKFQDQHAAQKSKQSSINVSGVSSTISPKRKTSFITLTFQVSNIEQKKQVKFLLSWTIPTLRIAVVVSDQDPSVLINHYFPKCF